jgi:hypothetical protein
VEISRDVRKLVACFQLPRSDISCRGLISALKFLIQSVCDSFSLFLDGSKLSAGKGGKGVMLSVVTAHSAMEFHQHC